MSGKFRSRSSWWLLVKLVTCILAGTALLQLAVGLFGLPRCLTAWLCGRGLELHEEPRWIVVLGGSGIPSASALMRTYYGAEAATRHRRATVVVALPASGDPEESSVGRMKAELVLRGVSWTRVRMETEGRNTHEQAVQIRRMVSEEDLEQPLLVVTSPYHVRRSVLCFRAVGFKKVAGLPAISVAPDEGFRNPAQHKTLGTKVSLLARYGFWRNLQLFPEAMRECLAIGIYRLRGWL